VTGLGHQGGGGPTSYFASLMCWREEGGTYRWVECALGW
jgi:hypothetical protein